MKNLSLESVAFLDAYVPSLLTRNRCMPMSAEEEKVATWDELVRRNLLFVVKVAKEMSVPLPLSDRVQEGNLGLIEAARRYKPEMGYRFITYAVWWIRRYIKTAADNARTVRQPMNALKSYSEMERTTMQMAQESGEMPSVWDVAEATGKSAAQAVRALQAARFPLSLDYAQREEGGNTWTWLDTLADNAPAVDEQMEEASMRDALELAMEEALDNRERHIIRRYYGTDGDECETLQEIATRLRLSKERVRQIKANAEHLLRRRLARMGVDATSVASA